ncbi:MAG: acylneuraminate cytidylyltransferase family protein [Candidatus Edwardsbacteria bacterium]|nr:acylneuraminate cytidylyltransferase family protein [Candidatus Edwardsbacteria bacterium]
MNILALIPARSGSKSIINKNIRLLGGKPLLAYSIEHARRSKKITRIIVSTDSRRYAAIANKYGAETPFLRPREMSGDRSTDLEVFIHALEWLRLNEDYQPEICVHLRPTYPIRNSEDIDKMVRIITENPGIDSVRSVVPAPETPFKMWFRDEAGKLSPVIKSSIKEAYNMPRQSLPKAYLQNASIDVIRTNVILNKRSMTGDVIHGYVMDHFWDIDRPDQLKTVRKILKAK